MESQPPEQPLVPSSSSISARSDEAGRQDIQPSEQEEGSPPKYVVNLDLPPRQRYQQIGKDYKEKILTLTPLFDEVLSPVPYKGVVSFIARAILRRVHTSEEQEEIKGLVEVTGVPLYLMIAFNTFLDTFMGCTSGAVRLVPDPNKVDGLDEDRDKMVHFRTLDWGMDGLRSLLIEVDYQRGGKTIARAITYAGFVGVLTGVRKSLSISLNFRPAADENTTIRTVVYHKLLVLLGLRPSVASQLRGFLIPKKGAEPLTLAQILEKFPKTPCAPSYVTLCDGTFAAFIEKDVHHANVRISEEFLSGTNHDARMESWKKEEYDTFTREHANPQSAGMAVDLLVDSQHRQSCIAKLYSAAQNPRRLRKSTRKKVEGGIGVRTVAGWCQSWPITNECTHFSCVMDPKEGDINWLQYHLQPPDQQG
ncbi:hypothetical protein H072_7678 [Dactylellina haptotyla CBS 200.50]|uniref:ceramidase n=1 Tax=Dactylellina haptotyla (strain CBS 200.50) TaxID=1284197 RepID=S8BGU4_DACHA|nr:hypothetical protein H072_7678 [Dactylellina haptotyla CBS 200.50]